MPPPEDIKDRVPEWISKPGDGRPESVNGEIIVHETPEAVWSITAEDLSDVLDREGGPEDPLGQSRLAAWLAERRSEGVDL